MPRIRFLHTLFVPDPRTGGLRPIARQGQTGRIDRDAAHAAGLTAAELMIANWRRGLRIRVEETQEVVDVDAWNVEPA